LKTEDRITLKASRKIFTPEIKCYTNKTGKSKMLSKRVYEKCERNKPICWETKDITFSCITGFKTHFNALADFTFYILVSFKAKEMYVFPFW